MYLTANAIPTNILSNFLAAIPIVMLTLSGFTSHDVDDDHLENMYTWNSNSLWILRVATSFFIAILCLIAYQFIRSYPLSQEISEQLNKVVKRRELSEKTDSSSVINKGIATAFSEENLLDRNHGQDEEVLVSNEEREDLLHLSVAELYRVYAAIDSTVYRPEQGVYLIKTSLKYGFCFACMSNDCDYAGGISV